MDESGHMTYRELFRQGKGVLEEAGVPEAELNARLLLEQVCGTSRSDLLAHGDRAVAAGRQKAYEELIDKRRRRIPLQHLTGTQNFMGLDFLVNENVLIPRQDTEILAEEALKNLHDGMRVLDMCTGSGCILISLLHYSNNCEGVGADISEEALTVARENGARLLGDRFCVTGSAEAAGQGPDGESGGEQEDGGKRDAGAAEEASAAQIAGDGLGGFSFVCGDLFEGIQGKFDIIVSNPPYIPSGDIPALMPEVQEHEPLQALDGGGDGLLFYRRILEECGGYLFRGGMLFFEIGHDQGQEVSRLMEQAGFVEVNVVKDYGGLDRVVYGTLGHRPDQGEASAKPLP